jgi:two-component system nitrogen regulation response regulator GlnG
LHGISGRHARGGAAPRVPADRPAAQDRARRALNEQQQANRELIRNLAHEIRNPLGGIRGAAQLLERELDRPQLIEYTQVVIGEADRLQSLVNRLLTPHRLPTFQRTNIHEIVSRVRSLVQAEFPRVEVICDFDTSLPSSTPIRAAHPGDAQHRPQCCASARRDGRESAIRVTTRVARYVTLARKRRRVALALSIEDNGPGIPEAIRDRSSFRSSRAAKAAAAWADAGPGVHRAACGRDRMRERSGMHGVHGAAAARIAGVGRQRMMNENVSTLPGARPFGNLAPKPVWIVDDDRSIRWVLEKALERDGIVYESFVSAADVLQAIGTGDPCVLVSDIRMPGESGLVLLDKVKERFPRLPVIIMTAYSDLDSAVAAFQGGAFEYLPKAVRRRSRRRAHPARDGRVVGAGSGRDGVRRRDRDLGQAPAMQDVFRRSAGCRSRAPRCSSPASRAPARSSCARALHRHSPRASGPVHRDQHRRRSRRIFSSPSSSDTSAARSPARRARAAGASSRPRAERFSLDEIGDMPSDLQVRLLRVLADGEYYRVGGHAPQKSNVRVITATHQNLEERVRLGLFREDLLHRLDVVRVRLPPLRERQDDIAPLARHFLAKSARELAIEPKVLSEAAAKVLTAFSFPGNVRQLETSATGLP